MASGISEGLNAGNKAVDLFTSFITDLRLNIIFFFFIGLWAVILYINIISPKYDFLILLKDGEEQKTIDVICIIIIIIWQMTIFSLFAHFVFYIDNLLKIHVHCYSRGISKKVQNTPEMARALLFHMYKETISTNPYIPYFDNLDDKNVMQRVINLKGLLKEFQLLNDSGYLEKSVFLHLQKYWKKYESIDRRYVNQYADANYIPNAFELTDDEKKAAKEIERKQAEDKNRLKQEKEK